MASHAGDAAMNNLDANKQIAARYFECQRSGNLLSALDLFSEDVTWTIPGEWEMAGTLNYEDVRKMMEGLSQFEGGLQFDHHSITAEDDRVVIFTTVTGKLKEGRQYRNNIAFQFTIANGRIVHVIEAPDSAKSRAFWLGK